VHCQSSVVGVGSGPVPSGVSREARAVAAAAYRLQIGAVYEGEVSPSMPVVARSRIRAAVASGLLYEVVLGVDLAEEPLADCSRKAHVIDKLAAVVAGRAVDVASAAVEA
jgi:hypothetical protein